MPPAIAAAALAAVCVAREESWRREKLAALIRRFRDGAHQLGLPLMPSDTAIQPLLLGEADTVMAAAGALEQVGFLVGAIRPPTVPAGKARLRITLSAAHEEEHVDMLLEALSGLAPGEAGSPPV
jgi:8-amino-7-oxononanoate synthase